VRVHADTGEIRVSRMLGVFSIGRVINPATARSQFIGGMTMGVGMALHEHGVMDPRFGTIVNHDLADYHIPTCADVEDLTRSGSRNMTHPQAYLGSRIGRNRYCRRSNAIANTAYRATGVRARNLPLTRRFPILSLTGAGFRLSRRGSFARVRLAEAVVQ
jgi:xanthine dehydrogenase YagR molybdenum-binding subunit